ncbi:hypothetical protein CY0110_17397 [Crocosphaera chwakensis CCY0110]|uniref:Uncharacterized protein n=1 Tax=Crocosphaera chwakensis CCY0110 TaxID=391612 RepID=A3IIG1_9CHRO|nr:hypothetical protein CY0110_17397 [Crocosphaera chwakensis CCY0110]
MQIVSVAINLLLINFAYFYAKQLIF